MTERALAEPAKFFEYIRRNGIMGELSQSEVDGINAIVSACGKAAFPISFTAYALATAYHETAGTMQPISEYGGPAYFRRMYDTDGNRPHVARALGNTQAGDGVRFHGRGYVQLTGRTNYAKATERLRAANLIEPGEDLTLTPELAKRPDIAAAVMVFGMAEGWFTGRKLSYDLPEANAPARRLRFDVSRDIINGRDKAAKIADEAIVFQDALTLGGWA